MEESKYSEQYDCGSMSIKSVNEKNHDYHRGMLIFQNSNGKAAVFQKVSETIVPPGC